MKFISEYRQADLARGLLARIDHRSKRPVRFMEFCGGHTVTIFRYGIRQALPETITMLSGPGCPICVTANADLDKAIALARVPGLVIATFGDALKVPGSRSSLQAARAEGADVRIVYSTLDALRIAKENPEKRVVFLGIGFETTAPTIAASVLQAEEEGLTNYSVLSLHKLCPPVIKALLDSGEVALDGSSARGTSRPSPDRRPGSSSRGITGSPASSRDLSRWMSYNLSICWSPRWNAGSQGSRSPTAEGCSPRGTPKRCD